MKPVIPIAEIKARQADPVALQGAQARVDRFNERLRPYVERVKALGAQAVRANNPAAKVKLLREMLDPVTAAANGLAACGKGCSRCCHINVTLSAEEAEIIGKEIGVKPVMPARFIKLDEREETMADHYGTPCPFLVNEQCSIYESRPLACRTLFNMDSDALLCTVVPGDPPKVPYLDHRNFTNVIVRAFMDSPLRYADLRDFFPKGKR
jgi:Fe-S-cluster containining protein